MAEVYCGSEPCPLLLNSTCVFYTGESLLYIGVQTNDTLETIIVKINQAFQNAGVGYAFNNGLTQPTPFDPVQLGGALIQNTTIGGNFTLTFSGNVQAAKHITTGGSSSQFVKGDGTLDSTAYQPAANYITGLSGDATASGPGVAAMTLTTVNFAPGTFGNGNTIPIVTVNSKGLVTNITPVPVTIPPLPLSFIGDVVGSGFTGSNISLLLQNVNANPYNTITPLKFTVNGKGLVTSASPITASDIVNILGYYPGTSGTSGTDGTSGTSGTTGTSGTSGTSGSDGTSGTSGTTGTSGTSGTDGSGGTSGTSGTSATAGTSGSSGTSGTTGTSGTSATSGTSGTSGTDGTGGTSGTSGSTGTSGTSGTSGSTGTSGTSGTTGTSGSSGTSGSTGTSGSSGTTGTSGSSGTTGTSGSSGTSGTTGVDGTSGTSGTTGLDGSNGTSGTSGTTGTSGSSGTSGTTGTSGSSGTSGTTGTSGTSGLSGDRFKTTSTTTYTLQAPGNPGTLTVDPGLAYTVGQSIIIAFDANNHNEAEVTSYNTITGVINFVTFTLTGSGTYSSWFVNIDGASGGDGSSGTSGTSGTSATAGTSGTTGTSGSSGTSGTSATDGTSGTSGTTGIDGTSGSSGTSGTTGTSGSSGTSGTTGTSGSSGTSGTSATDGTGGTSGTSGSSGTSGTTGTSGTSATSGTSGTSATSGTTGTSGTSGTNGTGGTSGTSGTSATSGTSGTSGLIGSLTTIGTSGVATLIGNTLNIPNYTESDTLQTVILRNGTTNTGFNIFNSNDTYSTPAATNVPFIYLYNTGTTSTSNAVIAIRTSSATGGDPILSFDIGGVIGWSMGIDNSDADKFKISNSWSDINSNTRFSMLTSGEATFASSVTASSIIRSGGTSSQYLMADGSVSTLSNPVTGTGTTNYITKWTGSSTVGNSQIIDNGTNVSIGTFLPTNQMLFQVSGQGTSYGTVIISSLNNTPVSSSAGSNTLFVLNTFSGAHASIGLSSNDADGQHHRAVIGAMKDPVGNIAGKLDFIMRTTAGTYTTRATMLSNGNFGLGTETPNYTLDAVGTVRANIFTSSDSTSYQGLGVYNNTFIGAGNIASALIVNDIDGARYAISAGGYSLTFSKNVSGTSWATGMEINATSASDATPVVRVTNRLGVGKTPSVALDVNGAALISGTVRATSTGVDGTFADAYIAQYSVTNAEANAIQTSVSGSANLSGFRFQASNGNLSAGRTTIVDFLRDRQIFYGNVGIGITPSYKLDIVNSVAAPSSLEPITLRLFNGSDGGSAIYFQNVVGGQSKISFGVESAGSGTDDTYLGFSTGANTALTERMRITPTGQVLVGGITSSSSFVEINGGAATFGGGNGHLKVTSSSTAQTVLNISNSSVPRSWEFAVGGSASGQGAGTFYIYDNTAGDSRFTISTSGAARFFNTLTADVSVITPEIFVNGNSFITFNNERTVWGIHTRTTAATNNLGSQLKNIILCGGGANEGFAVMGYQFATTAFEVSNSGNGFFGNNLTVQNGRIFFGTTAVLNGPVQGRLDVVYNGIDSYGMNIKTSWSGGGLAISFNYSNSSQVGSINTTSSSTSYNTSSDYRLKQDLKDFNGLDLINKIKAYDFEWTIDKTRSYGVVAHELQEVINYAVQGQKDAQIMQGVDYSKLVPVLIKAVQEQQVQIQELKNKLS